MKNAKIGLTDIAIKLFMSSLVFGPIVFEAKDAHAEFVDETDEWEDKGEPTYEDVTEEEQATHDNSSNTQDADAKVDNSHGNEEAAKQDTENKKESESTTESTKDDKNSSTQDANAKVDNSHGNDDSSATPAPVPEGNSDPSQGEVTDWEDYDPTKDENWDEKNPVLPDNLEDEKNRKDNHKTTPTPTPTKSTTPTPTPVVTVTTTPEPTPTVVVTATPTPVPPIEKTGDSSIDYVAAGVAAGLAGTALVYGYHLVMDSKRKYYKVVKDDVKTLTKDK